MDDRSLTEFEQDVIDAQLAVQLGIQAHRFSSARQSSASQSSARDSSLRDSIGTHATMICLGRTQGSRPRRPGPRTSASAGRR